MSEKQTPFVPGARVAVSGFGDDWREQFVEKTYKSGNFTLKGSAQQWRPSSHRWSSSDRVEWSASQTGSHGYSRARLRLWDAEHDKEIAQKIAETKKRNRLRELQDRFRSLRYGDVTDEMLDTIATTLPNPVLTP